MALSYELLVQASARQTGERGSGSRSFFYCGGGDAYCRKPATCLRPTSSLPTIRNDLGMYTIDRRVEGQSTAKKVRPANQPDRMLHTVLRGQQLQQRRRRRRRRVYKYGQGRNFGCFLPCVVRCVVNKTSELLTFVRTFPVVYTSRCPAQFRIKPERRRRTTTTPPTTRASPPIAKVQAPTSAS